GGASTEAAWNAMAAGGAAGATASAAAPAAGKGPFLWKVDGGRAPLYLFGTIHVPDDRVLALAPSVEKAFAEASAVYTEIPGDRTQTQALIDAYLSGDMTVVAQVMDEAMSGDRALMARFQDIAITKRNNHMSERILALRREQPSTVFFVAVGTAHYAGPTGIV